MMRADDVELVEDEEHRLFMTKQATGAFKLTDWNLDGNRVSGRVVKSQLGRRQVSKIGPQLDGDTYLWVDAIRHTCQTDFMIGHDVADIVHTHGSETKIERVALD